MTLEKKPFIPYKLEEEREERGIKFTIRLNKAELELLKDCQGILEQPKQSTALKQLAWIGANVIREPKIKGILGLVFKNKRNNKRTGNPYL